jgi:hypothetical protein
MSTVDLTNRKRLLKVAADMPKVGVDFTTLTALVEIVCKHCGIATEIIVFELQSITSITQSRKKFAPALDATLHPALINSTFEAMQMAARRSPITGVWEWLQWDATILQAMLLLLALATNSNKKTNEVNKECCTACFEAAQMYAFHNPIKPVESRKDEAPLASFF